jgi:hypothetical protein
MEIVLRLDVSPELQQLLERLIDAVTTRDSRVVTASADGLNPTILPPEIAQHGEWMTQERLALLAEEGLKGTPWKLLHEQLLALPGPAMRLGAVKIAFFTKLGLKRGMGAMTQATRDRLRNMRAANGRIRGAAPQPPVTEPAASPEVELAPEPESTHRPSRLETLLEVSRSISPLPEAPSIAPITVAMTTRELQDKAREWGIKLTVPITRLALEAMNARGRAVSFPRIDYVGDRR